MSEETIAALRMSSVSIGLPLFAEALGRGLRLLERSRAELPEEQIGHGHREEYIDERERPERRGEVRERRDGFLCPHDAVDDPGLASELGDEPAGLHRDYAE